MRVGQIPSPFFGHDSAPIFIRNLGAPLCFFEGPESHSARSQTQPDRGQLMMFAR